MNGKTRVVQQGVGGVGGGRCGGRCPRSLGETHPSIPKINGISVSMVDDQKAINAAEQDFVVVAKFFQNNDDCWEHLLTELELSGYNVSKWRSLTQSKGIVIAVSEAARYQFFPKICKKVLDVKRLK